MDPKGKNSRLILVVAMTRSGLIGKDGALPWHLPGDLRQFRALTLGGTLIMGRTTFESLSAPLNNRHHLVVSRTLTHRTGIEVVPTLAQALARSKDLGRPTFLAGGRQIYAEGLPLCDLLVVSWIDEDCDGDVRFPGIDWSQWREVARTDHIGFCRSVYRRKS
ncbi:MAG: dihydrofolate reductase [Geothermobacteraceae bacterium]